MQVQVRDLIGPRAIIKDDGQKVFNKIHPVLARGESATLDFEGVAQFASPFFNFAIGQLLKDLTVEDLRNRLQIVHLTQDGMSVVKRVIENASHYHGNVDYRRIVDAILDEQSKESD